MIYIDTSAAQYENVNELRMFPFCNSGKITDTSGRELPMGIVSDASFVVPVDDEDEHPVVRMTSVHISQVMVSVCFRVDSAAGVQALSVTVSKDGFKPYYPYRLEKLVGSSDIGGVVSFGDITFPGFPATYALQDAVVHPCRVAVVKPGRLRSIVDGRSGERLSGDVGIDFSGYVSAERDGDGVRLSLEDGAAEALVSKCYDASRGTANVCGATPIKSINGIYPDDDGNIVLWFH